MLADFSKGSYKQRLKSLENMLYAQLDAIEETGSPDAALIDPLDLQAGGHAFLKHANPISDEKMIERMIREGVKGNGYFMSPDTAYDCIINTAIYKINEIVNWQMKTPAEFSSSEDYHNLSLIVNFGADIIGKCFDRQDNKFVELESTAIHVFLRRNPEAPCGFTAITAYPSKRGAHPTGREFTPEDILNKKIYAFRSQTEKTAYVCRSYMKDVRTSYQVSKKGDYIRMTSSKDDADYLAYISYTGYAEITKTQNGKRKEISLNDIENENPTMARNIRYTSAMIRDGEHAIRRFIDYKTGRQVDLSSPLDGELSVIRKKLKEEKGKSAKQQTMTSKNIDDVLKEH